MTKELKSATAEDLAAERSGASEVSPAEVRKRKHGNAALHGADVNTTEAADQDNSVGRSGSMRRRKSNGALGRADDARAKTAKANGGGEKRGQSTKTRTALDALGRKRGASLTELQEITGWQAHSVRGFLSGTVKKKLGLMLASEAGKNGVRRYRITEAARAD